MGKVMKRRTTKIHVADAKECAMEYWAWKMSSSVPELEFQAADHVDSKAILLSVEELADNDAEIYQAAYSKEVR